MNSSFHYRRKESPLLPPLPFSRFFPILRHAGNRSGENRGKTKISHGIDKGERKRAREGWFTWKRVTRRAQLNLESRLRQSDAFNQSTQIRNYESDGGFAGRWNTNRPTNHGPIVQFLTLFPRFDNLSLTTSERFHEIQPAMKRFIWIYIGF